MATLTETSPIPRLSAANLSSLRATCRSRWAARLFTWGDCLLPDDRRPFGYDDHVIVAFPPDLGPSLAESCRGVPVNLARRKGDYLWTHWFPDGPAGRAVRGFHSLVLAGAVERAWPDQYGIMGTLVLFGNPTADLLLRELDSAGQLSHANVCLTTHADDYAITRTPTGALVAIVRRAAAISCNLVAHSLRPGSRILRRLARDEEPTEADNVAPEPVLIPRTWYDVAPARLTNWGQPADVDPGNTGVGTGNIATDAVTKDAFFEDDSSVTVNFGTESSLGAASVTTDGGHVKVHGKATLHTWGGNPTTVQLTLYKGTLASPVAVLDTTVEVAQAKHGISLVGRDTSPASSQTYTLGASISSGSSGDSVVFLYRRVYAENTKATT